MSRKALSAALLLRQTPPSPRKRPKAGQRLSIVIDCFGECGMARQPGAFGAHPCLQLVDQRFDPLLAGGEPLLRHRAVDLSLDRKDLANAAHRLDGAGCLVQIGQLEELTSAVRPAASVVGRGLRLASYNSPTPA
jgi:hypothetical protein